MFSSYIFKRPKQVRINGELDCLEINHTSSMYNIIRAILEGVVISPPGVASVCSGGQLELTCTVPGTLLEWSFFLVPERETMARRFFRTLHSGSVPATSDLEVNSITFTFSRISADGNQPLVSRLLIAPVNDGLNGTEVNCTDIVASNTSSIHIKVINESTMISSESLVH
ncbi:MAG: hypothetical protein MJE68_30040 [Proteobacteria bacterium]|nr:hypothetical protein [Pseudomonadota bacterium]